MEVPIGIGHCGAAERSIVIAAMSAHCGVRRQSMPGGERKHEWNQPAKHHCLQVLCAILTSAPTYIDMRAAATKTIFNSAVSLPSHPVEMSLPSGGGK